MIRTSVVAEAPRTVIVEKAVNYFEFLANHMPITALPISNSATETFRHH